jgi:hypothetical protein
MPASRPLRERFWEKVDKQGPIGPYVDTPCWIWTASKSKRGYGQIGVAASRPQRAHRVSWRLEHGEIPQGVHVLHRCHNTSCVNPDHLYLGTAQNNADDRVQAGRASAPKGSKHPNSILCESDVLEIIRLRSLDISYSQIAKQFNTTAVNVCDICVGKSWSHVDRSSLKPALARQGARAGSRHPCYRITPEMRSRIQQMRRDGFTYQEIADDFKISPSYAHKICKT